VKGGRVVDYLLIDILRGLVYAVVGTLIVLLLKWAWTQLEKRPCAGDANFDEFYCDLCAADLTVDFTREQAETLYKTWQGQQKIEESERC
jgi:hypothetical protein